jgi:TolB protein
VPPAWISIEAAHQRVSTMTIVALLFVLQTESHLEDVRQLTMGGTHAEAYWSPDGTKLVLQAVREGDRADQIYVLDVESGALRRISNGKGKCTCGYFLKDGRIVYSTTQFSGDDPPPPPDRSQGYRWPLYREFEIVIDDGGTLTRLTDHDGYDAETTVSPDGKRLVFMSHRNGEFGLYTMGLDGRDVRKVTKKRSYTGGAFFSPDGEWLVYRSLYPANQRDEEMLDTMLRDRALIPYKGMVIEIYLARADGSEERALTEMGRVAFAPAFHPDGKRVIFTSDAKASRPGGYNLFLVRTDGSGLRQITFHDGFDGFPHFSPDGKRLVWISDRNAQRPHELNVFVARWKD